MQQSCCITLFTFFHCVYEQSQRTAHKDSLMLPRTHLALNEHEITHFRSEGATHFGRGLRILDHYKYELLNEFSEKQKTNCLCLVPVYFFSKYTAPHCNLPLWMWPVRRWGILPSFSRSVQDRAPQNNSTAYSVNVEEYNAVNICL